MQHTSTGPEPRPGAGGLPCSQSVHVARCARSVGPACYRLTTALRDAHLTENPAGLAAGAFVLQCERLAYRSSYAFQF